MFSDQLRCVIINSEVFDSGSSIAQAGAMLNILITGYQSGSQTISQNPNLLRYWAVNDNRTRKFGTQENSFMASPIGILDVDVHALCCSKELWNNQRRATEKISTNSLHVRTD